MKRVGTAYKKGGEAVQGRPFHGGTVMPRRKEIDFMEER